MKSETISRRAKEQLKHGPISARISELQDQFKKAHDVEKERIMYELRAIMEAKITDYVKFNGQLVSFKPFDELTEPQVRAIESIKHGKYGIELKLHGKSWTIERICKIIGYEAPKRLDVKSGDKEIEGYVLVLPSNGREVKQEKEDNTK